ncbi:putative MFS transporter [Lindgomyces ingoldianus]|uniref:MFS transporter n=1 Tax=Lindgomyces ingoldianus TaxID=673940 RepID=A0ACB6R2V8_9PLEO|nr:putative MFS transporter [Lindgomyces ingoldianus]KAF2472657.1 putative MFS transporter [Lindgomyces ingoldianus]
MALSVENIEKAEVCEVVVSPIDLSKGSGYVLDASASGAELLKKTTDGKTVLIPQPTDDKADPLNWSKYKKHAILLVVSAAAFLPDFTSAIGAVALVPQSVQYGKVPDGIIPSLAGNIFMLGAGGVLVVPAMAYFGRLPVLFWFILMALWSTAWCAAPANFEQFMAARIINGFFSTVAQGGGLIFINDIFFVHEHARKINIWSSFIIISPYLSPLITAFIIEKHEWNWAFWLATLLHGLCLIAIVCIGEETYYDRRIPEDQQPAQSSRLKRLVGVEQWKSRERRNSFVGAFSRPVLAICKPVVLICTIYYFLIFAWTVGVNTTLSIFLQPLYGFGGTQLGYFYFTAVVAGILGEVTGHWLHDYNASFWMRRNKGVLEPEARLWVLWIATPFMVAGLILVGFAYHNVYHYMVVAFGWGINVFGIMISTVGLNAYVLDSYPNASGEVSAWLNFGRTTGGFMVTYVQIRWATKMGPQNSFSIQGSIVAAAFFLIVGLQVWGKRLRKWGGELKFQTN